MYDIKPPQRLERKQGITSALGGLRLMREGLGEDLPISIPKDSWSRTERRGMSHISRKFEMQSAQSLKMFLCDIVDIQERSQHEIEVEVRGTAVTVRTTTHDLGEPTEIDREVAREIDACHSEIVGAYK